MNLLRFMASLDAVEQIHAQERSQVVMDLAAVVSGAFAKKGSNPLGKHMESLQRAAQGDLSGDE